MPKVFSPGTLEKFEAAAASIPLRPLDRAFKDAEIRLGNDPGGPAGSRRTQFRRYVASVNQRDSHQLDRLGAALGALIAEVATSKVDFLVKAAESDGFTFVDGVFRQAQTGPRSFVVADVEVVPIEERGRRLRLLAEESPKDAIAGARELVASVCRAVLRVADRPAPGKSAGLGELTKAALKVLDLVPASADARKSAALVAQSLQHLASVVDDAGELRKQKDLSPRHAQLAVGAAVTFATFVVQAYEQQGAAPVRG